MVQLTDIHPLTDFLRNARAHVRRLKRAGRPAVLTINGKAELVVQDARAYQKLLAMAERLETIDAIRRGLDDADAGRVVPLEKVRAEMRRKYRFAKRA